jgi:hypothetical protein
MIVYMFWFAVFLFYLASTGFIAEKVGDWYDANFKMPGRLRKKAPRIERYIRKVAEI